eukprot:gene26596-biopygen16958
MGDQSARIKHTDLPRGGGSPACAQSLFRSCAPVSVKYGYFACMPETYPEIHAWSYPDWYLAASLVEARGE